MKEAINQIELDNMICDKEANSREKDFKYKKLNLISPDINKMER